MSSTPREHVLVVAHPDGWLEVYAGENVSAYIAQAPCVHGIEGEIMAEQYIEATIPRVYRKLYWPGCRRAADLLRPMLPSEIEARDIELGVLKELRALASDTKRERQHTTSWTI